jgi:hypothetical protein
MAKLIFVHGIKQEGKTSESLTTEWMDALTPALAKAGYAGAALTPAVPFYGDILADLAKGTAPSMAEAQGGAMPLAGAEEAAFMAEGMEEIAAKNPRVDSNQVAEEAEKIAAIEGATAQGGGFSPHNRVLNSVVRVLERVSPLHGDVTLRLLRQAYVYLRQPGAGDQIDARVAPHLSDGPCVIVAHSLGTIVTFKLLRRLALEGRPLDVPLLVTVGSPLSLRTVRKALGPSFKPPTGIGHWLNAYDVDDFVALGQGLTKATFADGIENRQVENSGGDAHAIAGYLADSEVVKAIVARLT